MTDAAEAHAAFLEVSLDAVAANWRRLADEVGSRCRTAAAVKANAYGLGVARVAPALERAGCTLFFVATVAEAIGLRPLVMGDIAVLNGLPPGAAAAFTANRLIPVLNDVDQATEWARTVGRDQPAILQVDSGMARLGVPPCDLESLPASQLDLMLVMSHLACADQPEHPQNARQLGLFTEARRRFPGVPASLAASSGIFLGPDFHFDCVRPGAALYGVNPRPGEPSPVQPVVRLMASVIQTREIDAGDTVGYGASYVASRRCRVATLAVGYADGYMRAAGNASFTYIGDHPAPVIGRISMDLLTLDVSDVPPHLCQPGDRVELLGARYGADDLARASGTIGYEILTSLGRRYRRTYLGDTP